MPRFPRPLFLGAIKFSLLLLACLILAEIDVDFQALQTMIQEQGLVDALRQQPGNTDKMWRTRHPNTTAVFTDHFSTVFESWFQSESSSGSSDTTRTAADKERSELHHQALLDIIAAGRKGEFGAVKTVLQVKSKEGVAKKEGKQHHVRSRIP